MSAGVHSTRIPSAPPDAGSGRGMALTNRKGLAMDSMAAFMMGQASRGNRMRVFDWERAADRIRETRPSTAGAGLQDDWDWTGGEIWGGEAPIPPGETYTYLASSWATPELSLDGEIEDCWRWIDETPGWDARTYWPPEAIAHLARVTR